MQATDLGVAVAVVHFTKTNNGLHVFGDKRIVKVVKKHKDEILLDTKEKTESSDLEDTCKQFPSPSTNDLQNEENEPRESRDLQIKESKSRKRKKGNIHRLRTLHLLQLVSLNGKQSYHKDTRVYKILTFYSLISNIVAYF